MRDELLTLVTLTKLHLLEQLPPKSKTEMLKQERPKVVQTLQTIPPSPPVATVIKAPVPVSVPAPISQLHKKPLSEKKSLIKLDVKRISKQDDQSNKDILELIQTHCPLLKLIEHPPEVCLKSAVLLFDQESSEEKQVLLNIASALKKEGFAVEFISMQDFDFYKEKFRLLIASRTLILAHPLFKDLSRRTPEGTLFFGEMRGVVIPSIAELIAKPTLRKELWNRILDALK